MSQSTIRRHCPDCGQHRPFTKSRINHILHFLLSLLTLGFWLPVWLLLGLLNLLRPFRCQSCGRAARL